jgi:hypothetical protein
MHIGVVSCNSFYVHKQNVKGSVDMWQVSSFALLVDLLINPLMMNSCWNVTSKGIAQ